MISVPHSYAEWVKILDMLKDKTDDAEVLTAMQRGTLEWQSGVAERFTRKLTDVINYRIDAATQRFQKNLSHSNGQDRAVIQGIIDLRKELGFLTQAINLPVIPEKDRAAYVSLVQQQAEKIQQSLEDSAKRDRTGKLSSIIRNNRIVS